MSCLRNKSCKIRIGSSELFLFVHRSANPSSGIFDPIYFAPTSMPGFFRISLGKRSPFPIQTLMPISYSTFAPSCSQRPSSRRSWSVMFVLLASGMVLVSTALARIRSAC